MIVVSNFISVVRGELSLLGLPLNHQPEDRSIRAMYQTRYTIADTVKYFKPLVKQYETNVNKPLT